MYLIFPLNLENVSVDVYVYFLKSVKNAPQFVNECQYGYGILIFGSGFWIYLEGGSCYTGCEDDVKRPWCI
jgi:hypothetical protein